MKRTIRLLAVTIVSIIALFVTALGTEETWICPNCGNEATYNFCSNCGTQKLEEEWICPNCGEIATGYFCSNCGFAFDLENALEDPQETTEETVFSVDEEYYETEIEVYDEEGTEEFEYEMESEFDGTYEYDVLKDGNAVVIGIADEGKNVVVPEEIYGHKVIGIDGYVWENVENIVLPDTVWYIGNWLLCKHTHNFKVQVSPTNSRLAIIDGVLFDKNEKKLIYYPDTLESYTVPDGIRSIGEYAFYQCENLMSVTIPGSVLNIEDNSFYHCSSLESITVAEGLLSIGDQAFWNCAQLQSITLPEGLRKIGNEAFGYCNGLQSISFPNSIEYIGESAFEGIRDMRPQVVDNHPYLEVLDEVLFSKPDRRLIYSPNNKETYIVPEGTKIIASDAFAFHDQLTSIVLPESLVNIEECAFYNCASLTEINLPGNLTSIGNEAFSRCGLMNIIFPESLISIGDRAFSSCYHLVSVEVPEGVEYMGYGAFEYCDNLEVLKLPASLVEIGGDYELTGHNEYDGEYDDISFIVPQNSYAEEFCKKYSLFYTYPDSNDWLYD